MEKWKARWENWEGLDAGIIKIIAVVSMLIDHTAAGILARYMNQLHALDFLLSEDPAVSQAWIAQHAALYYGYTVMRGIGRLAFPIYCYFLAEGLKYTRNAWKYFARLLLFAVLSEIPFDLLFENAVLEFSYQNVYFTLAIGLLVLIGIREAEKRISRRWLRGILNLFLMVLGCAAAVFLKTDYNFKGIVCITVIYLFSYSRVSQLISGALVFIWEFPMAPLAFVPLALYKKKRKLKLKYFFYAVYPVHLFLLYLLTRLLGIWELRAL